MGQCAGSKSASDAVTDKTADAGLPTRRKTKKRKNGGPGREAVDPAAHAPRGEAAEATLPSAQDPTSEAGAGAGVATAAPPLLIDLSSPGQDGMYITDHNPQPPSGASLVSVESMVNRVSLGNAYVWLNFSHANPHLVAHPLLHSARRLAQLQPHGDLCSTGGGTSSQLPVLAAGTVNAAVERLPVAASSPTRRGSQLVTGADGVLAQAPAYPIMSSLEVSANTKDGGAAGDGGGTGSSQQQQQPSPHEKHGHGGGKESGKAEETAGKFNNTVRSGDLNLNFYQASRLTPGHVFVRRPGEVRGQRFTIDSCRGATVLLLDLCGSVWISQCEHCFIFVGPTIGTVELEHCHGCVVVAACGQVRLRHCQHVILSLLTAALPTLENCSAIGLTSLSGWYAYNEMPLHLRAAHLSPFINNYSTVRDLTPPTKAALVAVGRGGAQANDAPSAPTGKRRVPSAAAAAAAKQHGGVGGAGPLRKNFFYLDPWDFDLVVWQFAIATALSRRGLSRNVSFSLDSPGHGTSLTTKTRSSHGGGSVFLSARSTAFSARRNAGDEKSGKGLALFSDYQRSRRAEGRGVHGDDGESESEGEGGSDSSAEVADDEPAADHEDDDDVADGEVGDNDIKPAQVRRDRSGKQAQTLSRQSTGASQRLASPGERFNVAEAQETRHTLIGTPLRLLNLPVATMTVPTPAAPEHVEADRKKGKKTGAARHPSPPSASSPSLAPAAEQERKPGAASVSLQLPPLSPRCVEDVLALYMGAMVAPTTLGACLIPRHFFKERWRLKLFVVTNKHGGWDIAQRLARDIELSRRQCFMEYARTVAMDKAKGYASQRQQQQDSQAVQRSHDHTTDALLLTPDWYPKLPPPSKGEDGARAAHHTNHHVKKEIIRENAEEEEDDEDNDPQSLFEHRYIPLAHRCGPVLLLNTVELRCTETVMREHVAPAFYKLTEPAEVARLRQQQQQQQPSREPNAKPSRAAATADGGSGSSAAHHARKTEAQRLQEAAELQRSIAIRRLFGEAIQRMSGQACVFFLALVAPHDGEKKNHSTGHGGDAQGQQQTATNPADGESDTDTDDADGDAGDALGAHEVGDDNTTAMSRYTRRRDRHRRRLQQERSTGTPSTTRTADVSTSQASHIDKHKIAVSRTQARRLNGLRLFQPLSKEEEDADRTAQLGSASEDDDESDGEGDHHHQNHKARRRGSSASSRSASPAAEDIEAAHDKTKPTNKRVEKKPPPPPKPTKPDHHDAAQTTKRTAAGAGKKTATLVEDEEDLERSQEERVWSRCVLLNVSVPLNFVSLLQSSVFFKASILSASTSGGYAPAVEAPAK